MTKNEKPGKKNKHFSLNEIFTCFSVKAAVPYILFTIGMICYILGMGKLIDCNNIVNPDIVHEILLGVGNLLLVSVIISFITSYAQFKKVYQNGLEEIIYNPEFLSKRNDIDNIWKTTSIVLFKSKFPEINEEIFEIVRKRYFPLEHSYYCNNQSTILNINWYDKNRSIIEIVQEDKFDVIASDNCKFNFPNKFTFPITINRLNAGLIFIYLLINYLQ